jgi:hypothetical protein
MKGTLRKVSAAAAIAVMLSVSGFADTRIRFAKGRSSAAVGGRISTGGRVCYVAGARAGQTLTATITSTSGKVMIFESGDTSYTYTVETTGDQSVCADNIGQATRYVLSVSIQ